MCIHLIRLWHQTDLELNTRAFEATYHSYKSVFTWRHGGHIGVPKQWNGGHVGVPNQSPIGVELFSYANALFCYNKFAYMLATWVKTLYTVKRVPLTKNRWRTPFVACNNKIAWPLWAWISSQSGAKGFQRFHANEGVQTASLQASSPGGK